MSKIVDTERSIKDMIALITARPKSFLFLDLEGVNLSRHGPISIMQILVPPDPTVYLVDVHTLGEKSFTTSTAGNTLRSILQSKAIVKIFFDVRRDSDALFHQFGINLQSVIDLQIMEFVSRLYQGQFLRGLAQCIQDEKVHLKHGFHDWETKKNSGRHRFLPELGGSYDVLLQRPIPKDIVDYCVSDVLVMPSLLLIYGRRLGAGNRSQVQRLTNERIAMSQSPSFNSKGAHMARGPSRAKTRSDASDPVFPMILITPPALEGICHLDRLPEPAQRKDTDGIDANQLIQTTEKFLRGQSARTPGKSTSSHNDGKPEVPTLKGSGTDGFGNAVSEAGNSKAKPEGSTSGRTQIAQGKSMDSSELRQGTRGRKLPLEDHLIDDDMDDTDDHLDDFLFDDDDVDDHLDDFMYDDDVDDHLEDFW